MAPTEANPQAGEGPVVPGLEADPEGARLVADEERLLAMVLRVLEEVERKAATAQRARQGDDARLLELRDDVAVAKPEDLPALFEQMHHVGALRAQRGKGEVGFVDRASPYFGHLRLEENGKRRDVLIGSRSYVDSSAGIRIVDWRQAPVSRIYYRYGEGDGYEERLGDRLVEGEVVARRSVAIVGGKLVRVSAPAGTFVRNAEGRWSRADVRAARLQTERRFPTVPPSREPAKLDVAPDRHAGVAAAADKHLPAIASMLDAAQFELITKPSAGVVAVQGSAGSGKTTVGLHRVAYLAFADRDRYRPDKMLVVVPNEALIHYVKRVLPELGVEGVTLTTFARFSARVLPLHFPKLPSRLSDETPPAVLRLKSHPSMLRAIHRAAEQRHHELDAHVEAQLARWPEGRVAIDAWTATRPARPEGEAAASDVTLEQRVTAFAAWFAGRRKLGVRAAAELPDVTRGAIEKLGHELRRRAQQSVLNVWDELLTSRAQLEEAFHGVFPAPQLDRVHEWCVRQSRIRAEGERDGETPTLDHEDVPILLRLWQVLRGPLVGPDDAPLRFTHMFVDEVQDASAIELRVLMDLTTKDRSITLAGDTAQRMLDDDDDRGEFDWKALLSEVGVPTTTLEPLKVSYRSTAEITEFARGVLGPFAHDSEPIATRHGPPVELFGFGSTGEAVAFLADALKELAQAEPYANVALIARFPQQAEVYFEGLERAEVPRVRRVAKQDFSWDPGFDVTDVRQTKGLEFDEVILLETTHTSYPSSPQARHALYVGATRAAHQLWCTTSDKASALVTEALSRPPPAPGE